MAEVDIIALWNKAKSQSASEADLNIDEIISRKSKTPLYWIKVVLWIEFWMNLVSLPLIYFYLKGDEPLLYGKIMPSIIIIYLVYYQFLIQKIRSFDYSVDVKTGLKKLYGYLNFFFLHYKVVIWVFIPLGFAYGTYLAFQKEPIELTLNKWLAILGSGLLVCGIMGLLFNYLINLIYGRKIKRLKGIFQELETAEEESVA